jgi:Protein of unknown function (DUF3105)
VRLTGTALERIAIVIASMVLSIGLIAILSGFFQNHDPAGVSGGAAMTIGQKFPDLGHSHLSPGELRPPYNSDPPTSGAHVLEPILKDETAISNDQLLSALEAGDIVIMYGGRHPPAGLRHLADDIASGSFSPSLAAAGQAVILAHRPGTAGLIALAWTRMLRASSVRDPSLRQFAQQWIGHGAAPAQTSA